MNTHSNARLTPLGRAEMVRRVVELRQPVAEAAGLQDRSSRPKRSPEALQLSL